VDRAEQAASSRGRSLPLRRPRAATRPGCRGGAGLERAGSPLICERRLARGSNHRLEGPRAQSGGNCATSAAARGPPDEIRAGRLGAMPSRSSTQSSTSAKWSATRAVRAARILQRGTDVIIQRGTDVVPHVRGNCATVGGMAILGFAREEPWEGRCRAAVSCPSPPRRLRGSCFRDLSQRGCCGGELEFGGRGG